MGNRKYIEKLIFIALLVALSVVLGTIDRMLSAPTATQGVRLGLANIVILTGIYYLNFKESLLLIILKSLLTGLLLGNPMTFYVGFSGTILSFFIMYTLLIIGKNRISLLGISVSGGIAHNVGQVGILAVSNLYSWTIIFSLFWLIPLGIGTGIFVGFVVSKLKIYLNKGQVFKTIINNGEDNNIHLSQLIQESERKENL